MTHNTSNLEMTLADAWACFDQGRLVEAIELARHAVELAPGCEPNANAALGWFLLSAGFETEAQSILASSLETFPGCAPLHWYLGLVFIRQHRLEEASQALKTAVKINPELDEAAASLAWVLSDLKRYEEAVCYSRAALKKNAQPARKAQIGWLLVCTEQWSEAVTHLAEVVAIEPARMDVRIHLATALQRLGRVDDALHTLAEGLRLLPDAVELLHQKARLLLDLRRTKDARTVCHYLLTLHPEGGFGWYLLAQVLNQEKRSGVALRALSRAQRIEPTRIEFWHQSGWLALETGRLDTGMKTVERVLTLDPDNPASHILAALILDASGDFSTASKHAELAVAQADGSAVAWRTLAQIRSRQNRLSEAEEALDAALDRDPNDCSDTYQLLGWVCLSGHRSKDAINAFAAALKADPDNASSWYGLATAYRADGELVMALESVQCALHRRHEWPAALILHGSMLIDNGPDSWDLAVLELSDALRLEPSRGEARYHLSNVLHRQGRDNEALSVLREGLLLTPAAPDLLEREIRLLLDLRRTTDARAAFRGLLRLQPLDGMTWYLLARVLMQNKRPGLAIRALDRARRLSPDSSDLWRHIGWLALEIGNVRFALETVERVLVLAPEDPASDILAAVALATSGDLSAASTHAERAVARRKGCAQAWRALAQVRTRQGRLSDAKEALHTALGLEAQSASETYLQLGWVYCRERHFGEAVAAFRAAVKSNPKDASSWYGLAEAYRADGKFKDALNAIKPTLTLRDEWSDRQLRGQIIHEQIYDLLKKKWNNLGGNAQPLSAPVPSVAETVHKGKYDYVVCSLSTKSHLPLMNTFANSVRRHFSGHIYLLVVDSDDSSLIPVGTTLVRLGDVIEPSLWQEMVERYNILELCCALKSFLMRFLARTVGLPIIYMDADTYLMEPLDVLLPDRKDFSVFLTPHLLYPFSGELHAEEIGMLCVGVYNGGMIGVGLGSDGIRFLDWWMDRVSRYAYDSREQGVFTDQKWLDLVPCFFKDVQISRSSGLNLGHWRVCSEKDFALNADGKLTFCGEPVTLMHMSGFKSSRPDLLAQHLRPSVTMDSPLGIYLQKYAQEVIQNSN